MPGKFYCPLAAARLPARTIFAYANAQINAARFLTNSSNASIPVTKRYCNLSNNHLQYEFILLHISTWQRQ